MAGRYPRGRRSFERELPPPRYDSARRTSGAPPPMRGGGRHSPIAHNDTYRYSSGRPSFSGPPVPPRDPALDRYAAAHNLDRATSADLRPVIRPTSPDGRVFRPPSRNSITVVHKDGDTSRRAELCAKCERKDATVHCEDCREYFCSHCHQDVHTGRLSAHITTSFATQPQSSKPAESTGNTNNSYHHTNITRDERGRIVNGSTATWVNDSTLNGTNNNTSFAPARQPAVSSSQQPSQRSVPQPISVSANPPAALDTTNTSQRTVASPSIFPGGQTRYCDEHEGERLTLFCVPDEAIVCAHCLLLGEHKGHECVSLKTAYNDCQRIIDDKLAAVQESARTVEQGLTTVEQRVREVAGAGKAAQVAVRQEMDQLRAIIDARERALLNEVRTAQDNKLRDLEALMREQEAILRNLHEGIRAGQSLSTIQDGYSFFQNYNQVHKDLNRLMAQRVGLEDLPVDADFQQRIMVSHATQALHGLSFASDVRTSVQQRPNVQRTTAPVPSSTRDSNHAGRHSSPGPASSQDRKRSPVASHRATLERTSSRGYDDNPSPPPARRRGERPVPAGQADSIKTPAPRTQPRARTEPMDTVSHRRADHANHDNNGNVDHDATTATAAGSHRQQTAIEPVEPGVRLTKRDLFKWDAESMGSGFRLSNDSRTCVALSSFLQSVRADKPFTSGMHYWELLIEKVAVCTWVGVVGPESDMFSFMGRNEDGAAYSSAGTVLQRTEITTKVDGPRYQSGDTVSCFLNMEGRTLTFGINNVGVMTLTNLGPELYPAISMPHPGQVTLLRYESL